jgi:DNA-binding CsgD family transcriptional regulator
VTTVPGHALASRLGAATRSCRDVEALAAAVCASVAAAVPYAFGCLATTDPATGLISWAYKTHPLEIGDEEFAAAEYGAADINQFAEIARRPEPVAVLSIDTGGRASSCRRFREFLAPRFGFTDELRVAFRAQGLTWAVLALYRGEGQAPFSAQDARALAAVHELVARIVRRVLFAPRAPEVLPAHGPAVLIVDADDRVREMTAAARHRIHELGGWENDSLPTSMLALAVRARTAPDPASTRVRTRSGLWLTLRATTLDGPAARRDVVITVDPTPGVDMSRLTLAARGLTAREQDVANLVLQGASTRAIAAALYLSPHTVQDHLKGIFSKLGVNSRRDMIAQLALP